MNMKGLSGELMKRALSALDSELDKSVEIVIGGGGAMIMAHNFPLVTHDIDAVPLNMDISELDPLIKKVAKDLDLPGDWLNPYYSTFTYTLPKDYKERTLIVFQGEHLLGRALGLEDMLIMKCFAHRTKDIPHAKKLIESGANLRFVGTHIENLAEQGLPEAQKAIDFFDEIVGQI